MFLVIFQFLDLKRISSVLPELNKILFALTIQQYVLDHHSSPFCLYFYITYLCHLQSDEPFNE